MADLSKLHPVFRERLEWMMAATGTSVRSGWRSSEEQAYLYNCYLTGACNNGNPANRPGESNHEAVPWGEPMALAADMQGDLAAAHAVCAEYGIHFPIVTVEPWHCQPVEVPYAYYTGVPDLGDGGAPGPDVSARRRSPAELHLSSQGAALIAEFEGFSATVYRDPVGIETIGYGETRRDIIDAYRESGITQEQAYQLLLERAEGDYAPSVRALGVPMAQSEFDALVSFAYNLGAAIFDGSTMGDALRSGDYAAAADAFRLYVKAGGRTMAGLVRRRSREAALFRSEWGTQSPEEDDMPGWVLFTLQLNEGDDPVEVAVPPSQGSGGIRYGDVVLSFACAHDAKLRVYGHEQDGTGHGHPDANPDDDDTFTVPGRSGRHGVWSIPPGVGSVQVALVQGGKGYVDLSVSMEIGAYRG